MEQTGILARGLSKTYSVPVREPGLAAALRQLGRRRNRDTEAVKLVSFVVQPGERVGFIGPNGAGKTTTLMMLSGLLCPTAGEARVSGHVPWERRPEFRRQISMVMGNRDQLAWALPAQGVRLTLTWLIPVGTITTVPASALSGSLAPATLLSVALFVGVSILFRRGLRRYNGASS